MSLVHDAQPGSTAGPADVPARADGLQLLGDLNGSGMRRPPALVRRGDGQVLQLTPLLYRVLEAVDGRRTYPEIAAVVSASYGRPLDEPGARQLVQTKLRPLGVLRNPDGSSPVVARANPLLRLRFRVVVTDRELTRRLTAPFAWLFHPVVLVPVVGAFVLTTWWVLFVHGLALAAHQAFTRPGLLLAVFLISVASAGFHEFGHAAAARYGGATPGAMGMGIYLAWPAFYTDVTDSYRLGRAARIRTDLGGLYFNALLSVAVFGAWWLSRWDALLLVIATQLLQMVRQLPPMIRFDGYHLLADLTGVPDLFHRIGPTLRSLVPLRRPAGAAAAMRTWVRVVVTVWVLLVVPLMLLTLLVTVLTLPRIVASAGVGLARQWGQMMHAFGDGHVVTGLARLLGVVAILVPVLGIGVMLTATVRRVVRRVVQWSEGRPIRRTLSAAVAAALMGGLAYAWWPHGDYHAIRPSERGTLQQAFARFASSPSGPGLAEGRQLSAQTLWPRNAGPPPTHDHPALSLVLVPRDKSKPTWVFPFNRPAPPGAGDNQALAVNTTDGSTVYDVAFAMVWAGSDTVLNKNEAYAFASCTSCTTVAVAFQVVLIVGQAHVVVPQDISAAVNYACVQCLTQALATQLVVTMPNTPTTQESVDLTALWAQIAQYAQHLQGQSVDQIQAALLHYEQQILQIIRQYAPASPSPGASSTGAVPTTGSLTTGAGSVSGSASDGPSSGPSGAGSSAVSSSSASSSSAEPTSSAPSVPSPTGTP